jgi:Cu(I)/Ag(I) efflux system membrane protein CusA/SilA
MVGSTLLAVTLVPVLVQLARARAVSCEDRNIVMRLLLKIYDPVLNWALNHRKTVIAPRRCCSASALLTAFGLPRALGGENSRCRLDAHSPMVQGFGKEFMPPLNEGSLLYMPVLMPKTVSRKSSA